MARKNTDCHDKIFFENRFKELREAMRDIRDIIGEFRLFNRYTADDYKEALNQIDKILRREMF